MYWLRRLFRKQQTERQLDSELRFHMEQRAAEMAAAGIAPDEARRQARIEFGGIEGIKEECRESRRVHLLETLLQDVRYGMRMMRRDPGFTAVAVLTLALGIGANTAIFSVVNGVLLNPLPYSHPEQLVTLHESKQYFQYGSISYPNFLDWRKENRSFSAMAIVRGYSYSLTEAGEAEQINGFLISSEFLDILDIQPVMGRTLRPGEDVVGAAPVALISTGLWRRKFGAAADVVGKAITLDGTRYTIIGVISPSMGLPGVAMALEQGLDPNRDVYVPIGQWHHPFLLDRSSGIGIHGIGRLKAGVGIDQARADMDRISTNLATAYPNEDKGIGTSLVPLRESMVGRIQPFLVVLLAAVGFVLLIACVNVANLLLARSTVRAREFAVRIALGASQHRILRQLLTESVLLAASGGALGLTVSALGERTLVRALPANLPRASEITLDAHVLMFTMLVSLLSGILFGLAPALRIWRLNVAARMKDGGPNVSRARYRVQNSLVVTEIALALILLVGAGLSVRSLARLWSIDPGFDPHNVLTFGITLPTPMLKASPEALRATFRQIDTQLASLPGVRAVSFLWGAFPLQGDDEQLFWMEGQPKPSSPNDMNWSLRYVVGPDYLKAMRITLLRGRFIETRDDERSPRVIVVDEAFAEKFFPQQDPIGKRINLPDPDGQGQFAQIVGLVKHVKQWSLDTDAERLQAQMYMPFMQLPDKAIVLSGTGTGIAVRSGGDTAATFEAIRRSLRQMDAEQIVYDYASMEQIIADSLAARHYSMLLLGGFAALALLLASVGIYGVVSYVAGRRTHEIGIRVALGAQRIDVLRLVIGQGARMILAGVVAGVAVAMALTRLMNDLLFGVSPTDPLTFTGVAALLSLVALSACYVPARRAARVNPITALRCE